MIGGGLRWDRPLIDEKSEAFAHRRSSCYTAPIHMSAQCLIRLAVLRAKDSVICYQTTLPAGATAQILCEDLVVVAILQQSRSCGSLTEAVKCRLHARLGLLTQFCSMGEGVERAGHG